jgi:3' exoribonuclease, RNase T-like
MTRMMLDLETMSTHDDAAVVSIGIAVFNEAEVIETVELPLRWQNMSGHIDPTTIAWWLKQGEEAIRATFGNRRERMLPFQAGAQIYDLVKKYGVADASGHSRINLWANDPHFDFVILRNWWHRYREDAKIVAPIGVQLDPLIAHPFPFPYNTPRSFRTIVELAKNHGFSDFLYDQAKGTYTAHVASEDAAAQARVVIACEKWLAQSGNDSHQHRAPAPKGSWQGDMQQRPAGLNSWRARHEADTLRTTGEFAEPGK